MRLIRTPTPTQKAGARHGPLEKGQRGYLMYYRAVLREIANIYNIDSQLPFQELRSKDKKFIKTIFYGSQDEIWGRTFEGVVKYMERLFRETDSDWLKDEISKYMSILPCPECHGARLKKESLAVKIGDHNIQQVTTFSVKEAKHF